MGHGLLKTFTVSRNFGEKKFCKNEINLLELLVANFILAFSTVFVICFCYVRSFGKVNRGTLANLVE